MTMYEYFRYETGYFLFLAFCFIFAIFLWYILYKAIKHSNSSSFRSSIDPTNKSLANCPDLDESILTMVADEESYKVELLRQSLDMGHTLEDDGA